MGSSAGRWPHLPHLKKRPPAAPNRRRYWRPHWRSKARHKQTWRKDPLFPRFPSLSSAPAIRTRGQAGALVDKAKPDANPGKIGSKLGRPSTRQHWPLLSTATRWPKAKILSTILAGSVTVDTKRATRRQAAEMLRIREDFQSDFRHLWSRPGRSTLPRGGNGARWWRNTKRGNSRRRHTYASRRGRERSLAGFHSHFPDGY